MSDVTWFTRIERAVAELAAVGVPRKDAVPMVIHDILESYRPRRDPVPREPRRGRMKVTAPVPRAWRCGVCLATCTCAFRPPKCPTCGMPDVHLYFPKATFVEDDGGD